MVYFDQLEELFSNAEVTSFAKPVLDAMVALSGSGSLWVVATMRSDFRHRLESSPRIHGECIRGSRVVTLLPPRPHELVDIIREPAKAAGLVLGKERQWRLSRPGASARRRREPRSAAAARIHAFQEMSPQAGARRLLKWERLRRWQLRAALVATAEAVLAEVGAAVLTEGGTASDSAFREVMRELVSVNEQGVATRRYAPLARLPEGSASRVLVDNSERAAAVCAVSKEKPAPGRWCISRTRH